MPGFVIDCGYDEELALASVGEGWAELVKAGLAAVEGRGKLVQVKQKYGTLRLYADALPGTSEADATTMWNELNALEARSGSICEACGAPGQLVGLSWYATLCRAHAGDRPPTQG